MLYSLARSKIKSGDLLAWSHKSWGSWYDIKIQLVRMFTQSEYAHVGIAWCVGDRVFVLESVTPYVRIYPLSRSKEFYWIPLNMQWNNKVEEEALSKVGERYSQIDAVKAFFSLPIKNNTWECAEYVVDVANVGNIDLGSKLTPAHVVESALKLGNDLHFISN